MNRAMRRQAARSGRANTAHASISEHQNRYYMDFIAFPHVIRSNAISVITKTHAMGHTAIADFYNMTARANRCRKFETDEFSVRTIKGEAREMIYITMPATSWESPMACTHIAITYSPNREDYSDIRVFHIERGGMNPGRPSTAIGEMSESFHANYGAASNNDDDNIRRIMEIANEDVLAGIPLSDFGA